MSNTSDRRADRARAHRRHWLLGLTAIITVGGLTTFALTRADSSGAATGSAPRETNSMGMPVISTPGTPSGVATTDGVTGSPNLWALGRVPLNVAVRPTWTIANTGTDTVTLGQPHVQINQGCCPGALTYEGSSTLAPGETTSLMFELSMHPGMDGAHDMVLHVPVQHDDGTTTVLDLAVTGDFRG